MFAAVDPGGRRTWTRAPCRRPAPRPCPVDAARAARWRRSACSRPSSSGRRTSSSSRRRSPTLGPFTFTSLRYVVAALTLLAILRWRTGSVRWPAGYGRQLFVMGALGFGAYQLLWSLGLTQITAGDSALLIAASPVFTALLAGAVGMDRLTTPKLAGALIAFAGVAVVIAGGHELSLGASLVGDLPDARAPPGCGPCTRPRAHGSCARSTRCRRRRGRSSAGRSCSRRSACGKPRNSRADHVHAGGRARDRLRRARWRPASPTCSCSTRSGSSAPRASPRPSSSSRPAPSSSARVFLNEPIGLGQVIGGAIIVLGVWLTRRPSVMPRKARARLSESGASR